MSRKYRADVGPIRTRQASRVLIDPLRDSHDDGVAASLAIAFRRKRAWLRVAATRRRTLAARPWRACDLRERGRPLPGATRERSRGGRPRPRWAPWATVARTFDGAVSHGARRSVTASYRS